jgi:hypothetical protein
VPFTREQFLDVFARYNEAVWPFPIVAIGIALVILRTWTQPSWRVATWAALGAMWVWMGVVYHWRFFATINPAARLFALMFVAQGIVLAWVAVRRSPVGNEPVGRARTVAGFGLALYALLAYPAVGYLAGQRYPAMPTFGLPCPTVMFTFAALLLIPGASRAAFVLPALWAFVATSAAWSLGMVEDYALLPAALITVALGLLPVAGRSRMPPKTATQSR